MDSDRQAGRAMVGVAQLVEHRIVAPGVVGSIPITHPTPKFPDRAVPCVQATERDGRVLRKYHLDDFFVTAISGAASLPLSFCKSLNISVAY